MFRASAVHRAFKGLHSARCLSNFQIMKTAALLIAFAISAALARAQEPPVLYSPAPSAGDVYIFTP
jgi:hypothetical protein